MCEEKIQIKKASVKGEWEETDEDNQGWREKKGETKVNKDVQR